MSEPKRILYCDRASFNQGENAKFDFVIENDIATTIVARGVGAVCYEVGEIGGNMVDLTDEHMVTVYDARGNGSGQTAPTLTGDHMNRVTDYTPICVGNGQSKSTDSIAPNITQTLNCMHDQQIIIYREEPRAERKYIIRRLTPLECCRLQGFPDWWEDGVVGSDSARYKMWGNGIALPCAYDVLRRIKESDGED